MFHTDGYEAEDSGGPEEFRPVAREAWRRAGIVGKAEIGNAEWRMAILDTRNAARTGWLLGFPPAVTC